MMRRLCLVRGFAPLILQRHPAGTSSARALRDHRLGLRVAAQRPQVLLGASARVMLLCCKTSLFSGGPAWTRTRDLLSVPRPHSIPYWHVRKFSCFCSIFAYVEHLLCPLRTNLYQPGCSTVAVNPFDHLTRLLDHSGASALLSDVSSCSHKETCTDCIVSLTTSTTSLVSASRSVSSRSLAEKASSVMPASYFSEASIYVAMTQFTMRRLACMWDFASKLARHCALATQSFVRMR
jgi:hypothetical protein